MARQTHEPLNPPLDTEEAKAQLRSASSHLGLVAWVRRQPMDAMLVGVASGFMLGRIPRLFHRFRQGGSLARRILGHLT